MQQAEIDARINALLKGKRGKVARTTPPSAPTPMATGVYRQVEDVVQQEQEETTPTPTSATPVDPPSEYESARTTRKLVELREEAKALNSIVADFNEFRKNNVGVPIQDMLPTFGESMTQPTYGNNSFDHPEKSKPRRGNVLPNTFCNNV